MSGRREMAFGESSCALCAIVKDEGLDLLEWISYHRVLGFGPIYIYDNESDIENRKMLCDLGRAGIIEHLLWDNCATSPQLSAYNDCLRKVETDWLCFLDADEYLNLKGCSTVRSFVSSFKESVSAIAVNWRVFGSSGRVLPADGLVVEGYIYASCCDAAVNRHIKTLCRPSAVSHVRVHVVELKHGKYVDSLGNDIQVGEGVAEHIESSVAQINHYVLKSKTDFLRKKARGNANRTSADPDKFTRTTDQFFAAHDLNDIVDVSILSRLPGLRIELEEIGRKLYIDC